MEIKQEITQLVDSLPDEMLGEVLTYLRELDKKKPTTRRLSAHLPAILTEDREVLTKLAK